MPKLRERFVVNSNGRRTSVILGISDYRELLDAVEELESVRAYDATKASGDEAIPFGQAVTEMERALQRPTTTQVS